MTAPGERVWCGTALAAVRGRGSKLLLLSLAASDEEAAVARMRSVAEAALRARASAREAGPVAVAGVDAIDDDEPYAWCRLYSRVPATWRGMFAADCAAGSSAPAAAFGLFRYSLRRPDVARAQTFFEIRLAVVRGADVPDLRRRFEASAFAFQGRPHDLALRFLGLACRPVDPAADPAVLWTERLPPGRRRPLPLTGAPLP